MSKEREPRPMSRRIGSASRCVGAGSLTGEQRRRSARPVSESPGGEREPARTVWDGVYTEEQADARPRPHYMRGVRLLSRCGPSRQRHGAEPGRRELFVSVGRHDSRRAVRADPNADAVGSAQQLVQPDAIATSWRSFCSRTNSRPVRRARPLIRKRCGRFSSRRNGPDPGGVGSVPNAQPVDSFVPVNGLRIHYLDWGSGTTSSR